MGTWSSAGSTYPVDGSEAYATASLHTVEYPNGAYWLHSAAYIGGSYCAYGQDQGVGIGVAAPVGPTATPTATNSPTAAPTATATPTGDERVLAAIQYQTRVQSTYSLIAVFLFVAFGFVAILRPRG